MDAVDDFDWDGAADDLEELFRPYYGELLGVAYDDAADVLPASVSFDQSNPHIEKVIDRLAKRIRGVAETTREDVKRWVEQGTKEGLTVAEIARQIRSDAADVSKTRAMAIARTETATAYSAGSVEAYKEGGLDKKEWMASADSCDECQELDGEVAGVDDDFSAGVGYPPLHPNCTCAVAPVVD